MRSVSLKPLKNSIPILVSLLLHSSLLLVGLLDKPKPEVVTVELVENTGDSEKDNQGKSDKRIVELGDSNSDETPKEWYWGIGIYSMRYLDTIPGYGYIAVTEITEIVSGYSADSSGLQVNDIIVLINGQPESPGNDLRGEGPKTLILTIRRKGQTVIIRVERCKVYT